MTRRVIRHEQTPFLVGRAAELHTLVNAITRPPAVVLVAGEAGVGKTRVVREALRNPGVRQRTVLTGKCQPGRDPFPYGAIFDALRELGPAHLSRLNPACGVLRPYLPELAEELPAAGNLPTEPAARRHCLVRGVRALLDALGAVVLVIEDLHWADDDTHELVRYLIDQAPRGLTMVLTSRQPPAGSGEELHSRPVSRFPSDLAGLSMHLMPLEVPTVRSLARAMLRTEVSAEFADRLQQHTAGVPLVVEELLRDWRNRYGQTDSESATAALDPGTLDTLDVPARLCDQMAECAAGLTAAAQRTVEAAAVLRQPCDEQTITYVAETAAYDKGTGAALREALVAGVLLESPPGRYGFRHPLAQRAVYDALPGPVRRVRHHRAFKRLRGQQVSAQGELAYHAQHATVSNWLQYAEAAAEEAAARGDAADVVELVERVLASPEISEYGCARLAVRLSRVALAGLADRRIENLLRRIVTEHSMPEAVRGEIRLNLGILLVNQAGDYEQARADTKTAIDELRTRPALAARGMAALAMPMWGAVPLAHHEQWSARARELVDDQDDVALRHAVYGNDLALWMATGDPAVWSEARSLSARADTVEERRQLARTYANLVEMATWLGHYGAAEQFRSQARQLTSGSGVPYVDGVMQGTVLRIDWATGRWAGLAERCAKTLAITPLPSSIAGDAHLVLGLIAIAGGEWDDAAGHLDAAGLSDPKNASGPLVAAAAGAKTRLLVARGCIEDARVEAERAIARLRRKQIWAWAADCAPMLVMTLTRAGREEDAREFVAEFAAGVDGRDCPLASAALPACRGVLAAVAMHHDRAADEFDGARFAYAAMPRPYSAARAGEAAARSRLALGYSSATSELVGLVEEFAGLDATRDAARCRRALREAGVIIPSPQGRRGYGDELSPREREVAHLVALKHTNREIAEILFLSPRTVEQHVARVLRKLNLASRGDIVGV